MLNKSEQDPIERYLDTVSRYLRAMPAAEASAALEEMRSHLRTAIAEQVENGIDEEQAVTAVLKRFGSAKTVGQAIAKASFKVWLSEVNQRERIYVSRSVWTAVLLSIFGTPAIAAVLMMMQPDHVPTWTLIVAFILGVMGETIAVTVARIARRSLPSPERIDEIAAEYNKRRGSLGPLFTIRAPVSRSNWYSSSDRVRVVCQIAVYTALYVMITTWGLYAGFKMLAGWALCAEGQLVAFAAGQLRIWLNGRAGRADR